MRVLVIYDSFFGNTEQIAWAVGDALGSREDVEMLRVSTVNPKQLAGLELLIVGSPTRAFSPTPAIKKFLGSIPKNGLRGVKVAAFDTRISIDDIDNRFLRFMVNLFGYAARSVSDRLKKKGGELIIPPEGFYVKDSEGPLKEGELERATDWGKQIRGTQ